MIHDIDQNEKMHADTEIYDKDIANDIKLLY